MSDLTSELNLALAIDDDDTADYLTTPQGLRGSLLTLDGLFNATTGHAHNGSHQGGALQFLDLTVGQNLTVNGSSTLKGSVAAQQNLTVAGTLSVGGLSTLNSLDVTTTSRLRGAVTIDGAINSSGTLTIGQDLSVGRDLSVTRNATITGALVAGSISTGGGGLTVSTNLAVGGAATITGVLSALRGIFNGYDSGNVLSVGGSGVASGFFYNRSGSARCWDNVDFTFGVPVAANTLVQRDGSGLLSDPKLGGQADIGSGTYTFPTVTGNAGMWRYIKAWGANRAMNLTNGTLIYSTTQYSSGQYILLSGNSLSCYCDGGNWWVL